MIIRSLVWFAFFTFGFVVGVPFCLPTLQPRAAAFFDADQDYAKGNRVRAEALIYGDLTGVDVYLGSSLTLRLEPGLLEPPFERAAFVGGGPMTGLELFRASKARPRRVFIEANYAAVRGPDRVLLESLQAGPWGEWRKLCPALRPLWSPSNLLILAGFASQAGAFSVSDATERNRRKWVEEVILPDDSVVDDGAIRKYLGQYLGDFARSEQDREYLITSLQTTLSELRGRGTECVFYEMPVHPVLSKDASYVRMLERMRAAFPPERFTWIGPDPEYPYKTPDGFHLTVKSGVAFSQRLAGATRRTATGR